MFFNSDLSPITNDGIGGIEYLKPWIDELIRLIDAVVKSNDKWSYVHQTRAGLGYGWDFMMSHSN